jgi:hypothetical protein
LHFVGRDRATGRNERGGCRKRPRKSDLSPLSGGFTSHGRYRVAMEVDYLRPASARQRFDVNDCLLKAIADWQCYRIKACCKSLSYQA